MTPNTQSTVLNPRARAGYDFSKNIPARRHRASGSIFDTSGSFNFTFPDIPQSHVYDTPSFSTSSDSEEEMAALKNMMRKRIEITRLQEKSKPVSVEEGLPASTPEPIFNPITSDDVSRAASGSPASKASILDEITRLISDNARSEKALAELRSQIAVQSTAHSQQTKALSSDIAAHQNTIETLRAEKESLCKEITDLKIQNGKIMAEVHMQKVSVADDEAQGLQQRQKLQVRLSAVQQQNTDLLAENKKLNKEIGFLQQKVASPNSTVDATTTTSDVQQDTGVSQTRVVDETLRQTMNEMALTVEELGKRTRDLCKVIGLDVKHPTLENLMD
ncbi:hypothetical protein HJFPF1_00327 [Paramyrothecium foliicola]|nr:hypothetical protein HJFPF1_00327 [Paramyrothecium foliicola]